MALLVWVISGFVVRAFSSGEILDGTSMSGVELGGTSRLGAAATIKGIEPQRIELSVEQESFTVTAPQAGLVVDVRASVDRAYDAGRSGIGAVLEGPLVLFGGRDVEPVYDPVNQRRLNRTVNRISDRIDREPFVGALEINPDTLDVSVEQPQAGVRVRRGVTAALLLKAFEEGRSELAISTRPQPAPSPADVRALATDAERYLETPVQIVTAGGPARFTPRQVSKVLTIELTGDEPAAGIRLGADREETLALVASFAKVRDRPTRNARLDTPPLPPVNLTDQGDLSWKPIPDAATVVPGRTGRRILKGEAVRNMEEAVLSDQHRVKFPTEPVKPGVTSGQLSNATSLLGTFTTSFSCCEPRVENIQQMAKTVDGTVIGPGEQFSLNGIAGERTIANGYKPAPTIGEGNKLIDTVGGGVSQFSTTTYNAAYFAGLQIDLHVPHSFYIDRYPPGREATLNFGSIDLLWTNDTKVPVVVRSSASDTAVTVSIYGGNGGRRVKAETQSRSNNEQGGFDITIDRVIINPDGTRTREPYTTVYGLPAG